VLTTHLLADDVDRAEAALSEAESTGVTSIGCHAVTCWWPKPQAPVMVLGLRSAM
jgi:hypothetical protein